MRVGLGVQEGKKGGWCQSPQGWTARNPQITTDSCNIAIYDT